MRIKKYFALNVTLLLRTVSNINKTNRNFIFVQLPFRNLFILFHLWRTDWRSSGR